MPPKFTDKTIISLSLIVAVVIVIIFMFCGYKKYEDVTYTIIKTSDENPESESDSDNDDKLEQFYGEKLLADFSSDPELYKHIKLKSCKHPCNNYIQCFPKENNSNERENYSIFRRLKF